MINIGVDFIVGKARSVSIENKPDLIGRTSHAFHATRNEGPDQGASLECEKMTGTVLPSELKSLEDVFEEQK